jgi:hypothetical protein
LIYFILAVSSSRELVFADIVNVTPLPQRPDNLLHPGRLKQEINNNIKIIAAIANSTTRRKMRNTRGKRKEVKKDQNYIF